MKLTWLAVGVLALALLAVACGGDDIAEDSDSDGAGANAASTVADRDAMAPGEAQNSVKSAPGAATGGSYSTAPETGGGAPLPSLDSTRKIIFTATMALNAPDVGKAFTEASSLTSSNGGYIEKSAFRNDPDDNTRRSATLTIRVPAQNYDDLLSSLRSISGVSVASEGASSSEVTEQYIDLQSNQRNLERTEQQYLELLKQAKTIQEILTVQDRLTSVRNQIEQIQGRLKVLDQRVEFATVNLTIEPVVAKVEQPNSDWSLRGVFAGSIERSVEAARYVAAASIVLLVATAWLVIPLTVAMFLAMRFHRRTPRELPPPPTATA